MNKLKPLTNQQFLKELESRITNFTQDELAALMKIMAPHQLEMMKIIQLTNPTIYHWIQEKQQQLEKEKTDEEVKRIKKSLAKQ